MWWLVLLASASRPYWICLWSENVAKWEMERILYFEKGQDMVYVYIHLYIYIYFGIIIGRWFRNWQMFGRLFSCCCLLYSFFLLYDSLLCASLFNNNIDIYLRVNIFDAYEIKFDDEFWINVLDLWVRPGFFWVTALFNLFCLMLAFLQFVKYDF